MVIAEGPDASGKTTLAHTIADELGLEYRRPSEDVLSSTTGPVGFPLVEWWQQQLIRPDAKDGVYDRCFWISEPIYQMAQVQRPLIVPGPELMRGVFDLWAEGPLLVFCLPPIETQLGIALAPSRESLSGMTKKHLEKIDFLYWHSYALWLSALGDQTVMRYDYTAQQPDAIFDAVRRHNGFNS